MLWNWQRSDWPKFRYDAAALAPLEERFLLRSGEFMGAFRHIKSDEQAQIRIELICDEALKTSEIEGEFLNRDSVQSSLRRHFGLSAEPDRVSPQERGISQMMVSLYNTFAAPVTDAMLFEWHRMVMAGNQQIETLGSYRRHLEPMQVISGGIGRLKIHFEAPPSNRVPAEMQRFAEWFNDTAPRQNNALPALTRAGLAHLYFECIHPFEDGNGRIGRALSEKALAQAIGQPSLTALAYTIEQNRKQYYGQLEANNKEMEVTAWLVYFAQTVLEAQQTTLKRISFHIGKARFYEAFGDSLNERQQKVVARMFKEGIAGFKGGLSAENYISITGASRSTATRDLQELSALGALLREGERKHTRYRLNLETL